MSLLRWANEHWCQVSFGPGDGSDLAPVVTKVERDGRRIAAEKAWTSGGDFADYSYILTRNDSEVSRGSRVASGTDAVHRNIIAEQILGLPRELG